PGRTRFCGIQLASAPALVLGPLVALSWPNLPCSPKAALGYGKRTLGNPRQSAARRGPRKASVASAFARRSGRDMLNLSLSGHEPNRTQGRGASPALHLRTTH